MYCFDIDGKVSSYLSAELAQNCAATASDFETVV